jgi:hypothetical protein
MPKRTSTLRLDTVQNARRVVLESVRESSLTTPATTPKPAPAPDASLISRVMAEMGRRGGQIGGKRRLVTLTEARRSEIAAHAAKARWKAVKKAKTGGRKPK